jgi:type IV pilus assembly protein PilB
MIGELLVKEGLLSRENLDKALAIQKKGNLYTPVGEICVSQKFISRSDLNLTLRKYRKNIPLGELLINMQIITREQLNAALEAQKESRKKLGEILLEQGAIHETDLVNALSLQLGIPKILPSVGIIEKNLLESFNPDFLHEHLFLPAIKEEKNLTLIMANPLDQDTIELVRRMMKCEIITAIATASEIRNTITLFYQKMELGQDIATHESVKDLIIGGSELIKRKHDSIIEVVNFIISNAIIDRASDIHIEPQDGFVRVRYRVDGVLLHKTDLPSSINNKLTSRIKALCGLDIAEKRRHQDGRIQARVMQKEYDLRISTYAAIWGENLVIRIQSRNSGFIDINMIGFSPVNLEKYLSMLDHPSGIILVTGPTGSGKSTTLYASLNYLNDLDRVIITVEDPVEYTIEGVVQASIPPKLDVSYTEYLKAMMRQDPDVLMIGEIRDPAAAEAVIQASLTGHKVLSTFHTEDATGALLRLMDMGIETFLISSTLVSVVAQRLIRKLCEQCKSPYQPDLKTLAFFNSVRDIDAEKLVFYKPVGCIHCNQTGYRGMTGIHEVLMVTDAIRNEILNRSTSGAIKRVARQEAGLVTMSEDGFYKTLKGITSLDEVIRVVYRDESRGIEPIPVSEVIRRSESVGKHEKQAA